SFWHLFRPPTENLVQPRKTDRLRVRPTALPATKRGAWSAGRAWTPCQARRTRFWRRTRCGARATVCFAAAASHARAPSRELYARPLSLLGASIQTIGIAGGKSLQWQNSSRWYRLQ